ncbi:TGF-beta-activated kinase 1 and MAP3K7-binding protein 3-like isoform X2 [Myzus persicae]|uniref:TGF-beta-activated kinase 1 and MAP3K7-binding protein 3-like isoform X2 n=1 Tax=Myzus persicae TaxID=13164 RepID=UPI000B93492C|nr:TGF-beta-activated kinase 1 and MAP3K7-binding protein 3-like isoform X2 [Myzus persicae]
MIFLNIVFIFYMISIKSGLHSEFSFREAPTAILLRTIRIVFSWAGFGFDAMTFFKITVISTMVVTLATAWSGQFPQFYQTFPSRTAPPIAFRPLFQEPFQPQRYFVHQPQFRQPLEQYQTQFRQPLEQYQTQFRQPLEQYQPPTPPPTVIRPNMQSSRVLPTAPSVSNQVTTATGVHHHVYYYYFYLPLKGETPMTGRRGEDDARVTRQPCDDHHPITTAECPPVYLPPPPPPPSPTPPTSTTTQTPTPTVSVPPQSQGPCNDDTVVVDSVDYYPFRRMPIVVAPANGVRDGSENVSRDSSDQKHMLNTQPNFILANYLLPPDK